MHTSSITACFRPCCGGRTVLCALLLLCTLRSFRALCLPAVLRCSRRVLTCLGSALSSIC